MYTPYYRVKCMMILDPFCAGLLPLPLHWAAGRRALRSGWHGRGETLHTSPGLFMILEFVRDHSAFFIIGDNGILGIIRFS